MFPIRQYLKLTFSQPEIFPNEIFPTRHVPKRHFLNQTFSQSNSHQKRQFPKELFLPQRHFLNQTSSQSILFSLDDIFSTRHFLNQFFSPGDTFSIRHLLNDFSPQFPNGLFLPKRHLPNEFFIPLYDH